MGKFVAQKIHLLAGIIKNCFYWCYCNVLTFQCKRNNRRGAIFIFRQTGGQIRLLSIMETTTCHFLFTGEYKIDAVRRVTSLKRRGCDKTIIWPPVFGKNPSFEFVISLLNF